MIFIDPFVAAGMIEDPRLFVGCKDELYAIASRMIDDQPTSRAVLSCYAFNLNIYMKADDR
ncbi:hypothetical protein [Nostoc sphaeroides]|uniref:ATP-binding protein n=1 Tax=Nostoc sphaeroides CCNUC1 TaxID=2653204 RepID=A0A5P8VY13_9NOSO|nr:hypothetical protein [Nostoc sphaeroides]MCC5629672.1 hypothetical protein [Nostoc sphaeroides CHAB 2801]QFS45323.1 ATP-binding protein [Nostoc sphaeroides CCNUC1]